MEKTKLKPAVKGGAKKIAEHFERNRRKEPSDELVKIIFEYGAPAPEKKPLKDDRAAKDAEI